MPIYEYSCSSCNEEIETIQKVSDKPLTRCPNCQEETLNKKASMTSFQLKGGGWYSDGYGNSKADSGSKTADSKTTTKSADKSTETKTKTEPKTKTAGQSKAS